MDTDLLADARLHLVNFLKGKSNGFETKHPWRKGWEFAVLHSLRVEAYTIKILTQERHSLSEHEMFLLRLAAILHDIGRLEKRDDHAKLGAEIAEKWLRENPRHSLGHDDIKRVLEMISDHSNKSVGETDFCKAVLKDADTLDEIGVMSIFMTSNWLEKQTPFFFHNLRKRLVEFEIPFCDKKMTILNTDGARKILSGKKTFIENFIAQVADELKADSHIEQLLLELSPN